MRFVGDGSRSTIINSTLNGTLIKFDGVQKSGLAGVRLGLGSNAAGLAIDITSALASSPITYFTIWKLPGAQAGSLARRASVLRGLHMLRSSRKIRSTAS